MWVSYDEGLLNGRADMTTMKITAPTTSETAHPLYFDLIRLVEKLSRQSRDIVVATLDPNLYNPNNFWQQTYRWSQVSFVYLAFLWFKFCSLVILSTLQANVLLRKSREGCDKENKSLTKAFKTTFAFQFFNALEIKFDLKIHF